MKPNQTSGSCGPVGLRPRLGCKPTSPQLDAGVRIEPIPGPAAPLAAQAKLLACDVAVAVTQDGQVLHGGWGYAEEYPISRYVADAQVLPIFEGVKPILALKVVGRSLLAR